MPIYVSANFPNYLPHMTLAKFPSKKYLFSKIAHLVTGKKYWNWIFETPNNPIKVKELLLCKIKSTDETTGFYKTLASCPIHYQEHQNVNLVDIQRSTSYSFQGKLCLSV